jgi:hypothetical protein
MKMKVMSGVNPQGCRVFSFKQPSAEELELPEGWDVAIPEFSADAKGMATRVASGKVMNVIASRLPTFINTRNFRSAFVPAGMCWRTQPETLPPISP